MSRRKEKANNAVTLVLVLFVALALWAPNANHISVSAQAGAAIDLYTEKTPFDGKGVNQSSDTYEPQELVVLHALATYNEGPERNSLVAFQISGPPNSLQNITIVGSGRTDDNGIAGFSFRLPWPSENAEEIIFGQWFAIATVNIAGKVVVDALTFQVGWIIRITEIATLNSQLKPQSTYMRQDPIVFNLTIENNARTAKWATIKIDVQDFNEHPIVHIQMEGKLFQPGKSNVQAPSQIPVSAEFGLANASAAPFTAPPESGGRLYSPAAYTTFYIIGRDIAVTDIKLSSNSIFVGESLKINVTVVNKGNESEAFDLSTYYNSFLIETRHIIELARLTQQTFAFTWNTNFVTPGTYQISASAPLPDDANPSDNTYVDGTVEIKTGGPPVHARDVAVINVVPWPRQVSAGQIVNINATVKNKGLETESFYVTVYYDRMLIDKKYVTALAPSAETQILFKWNTTGVFPMNYVITAVADKVEGETQLADNTFVDGTVTISPYPPFFPTLDWLIFWLIVILALIIALVLFFLIVFSDRIRRRRIPRSTYTIIVRPHI